MKSNQASKAYAQQVNAIHAANGLEWSTPEGEALSSTIRHYKESVQAYMQANGTGWTEWRGDVMAVFAAVPFDFSSVPAFHKWVMIDEISKRVNGRSKEASKPQSTTLFTFQLFTLDMESRRYTEALRSTARALVMMRQFVREYADRGQYSHVTCNLPDGRRAKCSNRGGMAFMQVW